MRALSLLALLLAFGARAEVLLHRQDNGLELSAALDAAILLSRQESAFYIDRADASSASTKRNRDFSFSEFSIHPQLYMNYGGFYSGLSAIGAATKGDGEPHTADDPKNKRAEDIDLELGYIGWKNDRVDLSVGAQFFEVADGLLIADGNGDTTGGGATWLGPRNAFKQTAIARLDLGEIKPTAFYLRYHRDLDASELVGGDLAFSRDGFGDANIYAFRVVDSSILPDKARRKNLNVYALSYNGNPIAAAEKLNLAGSVVFQRNDSDRGEKRAVGWYGEVGYSFEMARVFVRRSQFSGDKTNSPDRDEAFDGFMPGAADFGQWFPGEIVGQQYSLNSDLRIWTLGLRRDLQWLDGATVGTNLYRFDYDVKKGGERHLGDEIDLFASIQATESLSLTPIAALLRPGDGAKKAHGRDAKNSTLLALLASLSF